MDSPITMSPAGMIFTFKQGSEESFKEAYDRNFDWIVPENLFDEESKPKSAERGTSKTTIDSIECLVETTFIPDLNDFSLDNT